MRVGGKEGQPAGEPEDRAPTSPACKGHSEKARRHDTWPCSEVGYSVTLDPIGQRSTQAQARTVSWEGAVSLLPREAKITTLGNLLLFSITCTHHPHTTSISGTNILLNACMSVCVSK